MHHHSLMAVLLIAACTEGCSGGSSAEETSQTLRIYHNPYQEVDWQTDIRLKGQHHDHIRNDPIRIAAYDQAGYQALTPMDYSGAPSSSVALTTRLWPIENFLSPTFLQSLRNIRIWFPAAEEVGLQSPHVTSPFLQTYIEKWDSASGTAKQAWQYENTQELVTLIRAQGGLPILAHAWTPNDDYTRISGWYGVEIYSAFAEARRRQGVTDYVTIDRNLVLLQNWDKALSSNQGIIGFAVNDHFGPIPDLPTDDDIRDSGKVIVLAKAATATAYRAALERGAVLAIKDMGLAKDNYPLIRRISVMQSSVDIDTDGDVSWISGGQTIATTASLRFDSLPAGRTYVRAEIHGSGATTIYTQAFWVRPVGDANGDNRVDSADEEICAAVANGTEHDVDKAAACNR